jgi:hypothetical protein
VYLCAPFHLPVQQIRFRWAASSRLRGKVVKKNVREKMFFAFENCRIMFLQFIDLKPEDQD